ncbi:MAG: nitroreductase [Rhodospirillaceae bacterium]|nr:nitroreductase [Rhodospirillaceae bacterium]MBT7268906.1 nitroreductase [Rhodospirillaceae bacterium]
MLDDVQNQIIEFLRSRRSVVAANLTDPGPTEDELNTIIEIGLRVPDHSRCGPWRIQIIRKEGQAKLGDLYADLFAKEDEDPTEEQIEYWRARPQTAPIVLAITCYPNEEKMHKIPLWEQILSGGAMCQNILNASHAIGYSAQWLSEWPAYHTEVKKLLGHAEDIEIYGFIFIGTATEPPKERKRIAAEDILSEWHG